MPSLPDSFLLFVPRSAPMFPFKVAVVAVCAWPLPIDAEARRPIFAVVGPVADLFFVTVSLAVVARAASERVGGVGSIAGLLPEDEESELPIET